CRQRLLGGELRLVRDLLHGAAAAEIDDRTGRIHARRAPLEYARRARALEAGRPTSELRLHQISRRRPAEEDDPALVARERLAAMHDRFDLERYAGRARSWVSFSTICPTSFFVSSSGLTNSMPIPGSSTPGPAGLNHATRPFSLHSCTPGNCKRTLTGVSRGGAWFEVTKTP